MLFNDRVRNMGASMLALTIVDTAPLVSISNSNQEAPEAP